MTTMPPASINPESMNEQPSKKMQESVKKTTTVENADNADRKSIFGHLWDGITYVPRKILGVMARHPGKTALVAGLLLYFGTPALMRAVGNVEGGLASVPQSYIQQHLKTTLPLNSGIPPSPMPESLPGGRFN